MWIVDRVWKEKPQGDVWVVHDTTGQQGYFKIPGRDKYYGGTMIANELIAASLAVSLGFPVAELALATIRGPDGVERAGVVSLQRKARELVTWAQAKPWVRAAPRKHVCNLPKLREMLVFDTWILNTDRGTGKNTILYRDSDQEKYQWYLIDHGNTLYGSPYRWRHRRFDSPHWDQLWKYYTVPSGLLKVQSRIESLEPMIRRIESLRLEEVEGFVDAVSSEYLPSYERGILLYLLASRKQKLRAIITRWLNYSGRKEYRR